MADKFTEEDFEDDDFGNGETLDHNVSNPDDEIFDDTEIILNEYIFESNFDIEKMFNEIYPFLSRFYKSHMWKALLGKQSYVFYNENNELYCIYTDNNGEHKSGWMMSRSDGIWHIFVNITSGEISDDFVNEIKDYYNQNGSFLTRKDVKEIIDNYGGGGSSTGDFPTITEEDEGKIIFVKNGEYVLQRPRFGYGDNLHDSSTDIPNTYIQSNGVLTNYGGWSSTDYIPIQGERFYVINRTNQYCCVYDEDKKFIQNSPATTFISPKNARYIRYSESTNLVSAWWIREMTLV